MHCIYTHIYIYIYIYIYIHLRHCTKTQRLHQVNCCASPEACGTCSQFGPVTPWGSSNRISFPEATGRIVTTGNVDELDLRTVRLEGLQLTGFFDFGIQSPDDLTDTPTVGGGFGTVGWKENLEIEKWQTHIFFDPVTLNPKP